MIVLIYALGMTFGYFGLKYFSYLSFFKQRPTLRQLWIYQFENDQLRGRNAGAFKYFAIFLFVFFMLGTLAGATEDFQKKSTIMSIIKPLILFFGLVNFFARNVLYVEKFKEERRFDIPILAVLDVVKKTSFFVKGKDFVSIIVNLSTTLMVVLSLTLFYVAYFK